MMGVCKPETLEKRKEKKKNKYDFAVDFHLPIENYIYIYQKQKET